MTNDLLRLKECLQENRITHVVMENTGIYWKSVFKILEDSFEVILVNERYVCHSIACVFRLTSKNIHL